MGDGKFHLRGKRKEHASKPKPVKLSAEAYNMLVEMYNDSGIPLSQIASQAILFAAENTVYDLEEK